MLSKGKFPLLLSPKGEEKISCLLKASPSYLHQSSRFLPMGPFANIPHSIWPSGSYRREVGMPESPLQKKGSPMCRWCFQRAFKIGSWVRGSSPLPKVLVSHMPIPDTCFLPLPYCSLTSSILRSLTLSLCIAPDTHHPPTPTAICITWKSCRNFPSSEKWLLWLQWNCSWWGGVED